MSIIRLKGHDNVGYERCIQAINLKFTDQITLCKPFSLSNRVLAKLIQENKGFNDAYTRNLYKAIDVDLEFCGYPNEWNFPKSNTAIVGNYKFFADKYGEMSDLWRLAFKNMKLSLSSTASYPWIMKRPFKTYKELLSYLSGWDPNEKDDLSIREISEKYEAAWRKRQELLIDISLVAGKQYPSPLTFLIVHFGYPYLSKLMYQDIDIFDETVIKVVKLVKKRFEAWARTGIKVFYNHDDVATANGPVMSPKLYKEHIAVHYKDMWRSFKYRNIKVIVLSSGNHTPLFEVYSDAGADGFHLEPDSRINHSRFEELCERWGGKKILVFAPLFSFYLGIEKDVVNELEFIISLARQYNGSFIFAIEPGDGFTKPKQNLLDLVYENWIKNRCR
jgi:hypothetical protein